MADPEPRPDGFYPRVNAALMKSGRFTNMIVSVVGVVESFDGSVATLRCVDNGIVRLTTEFVEDGAVEPRSTVEIVGQTAGDDLVTIFVVRKLSSDMDMEIYNRMIADVQQNPKFAHYFAPFVAH